MELRECYYNFSPQYDSLSPLDTSKSKSKSALLSIPSHVPDIQRDRNYVSHYPTVKTRHI
ncbi:hypothetical protein AALO_G00059320 [Alosa alosa]|uniref:Uncharacterized protein n=1 Tax=Alosa alosa TaxID=278164 RepID=A0AAV6H6E6_9TELE|nr:hypothetical protein AALO_G00059320 [Alosa alosa]